MIRFFRKIRQKLFSEDKFGPPERCSRAGNYLIYAIGEIVLVVIGILLALQMNTWMNPAKVRQRNKRSYKQYMKNVPKMKFNWIGLDLAIV